MKHHPKVRSESLSFPGALGARLAAQLDWPSAPPKAYALLAHCFTCSKDLRPVYHISQRLAEHGVATLRFDFTGLGDSEGEFSQTSFSSNVADLVAASEYLAQNYEPPQLLIGYSLGGTAALAAARQLTALKGVVTLAAPYHPNHLAQLLDLSNQQPDSEGSFEVTIAGRVYRLTRDFVTDLESYDLEPTVGQLGLPLLVLHSPQDRIVKIDSARRIYMAARHPKSFVSLDGAQHLLAPPDALYVADVINTWSSRYLTGGASLRESSRAQRSRGSSNDDGAVVVSETREGKFTQRVTVGRHQWTADEPVRAGGDDLGPAPYDMLLAALGACTAMTLRLYAEHKGLPLERASVRLRHRKIDAVECRDCAVQQGKVDHIEREVELIGDLSPAQRQRMLEIADRCPVHRTLHSEVHVATRLLGE